MIQMGMLGVEDVPEPEPKTRMLLVDRVRKTLGEYGYLRKTVDPRDRDASGRHSVLVRYEAGLCDKGDLTKLTPLGIGNTEAAALKMAKEALKVESRNDPR